MNLLWRMGWGWAVITPTEKKTYRGVCILRGESWQTRETSQANSQGRQEDGPIHFAISSQ